VKIIYAVYCGTTSIKTDRDYGTIDLRVVEIREEGLRNPRCDESPFEDISFNAQWCVKDAERSTYAWEVDYRSPFSVRLERAERMVKLLRRVEKIQRSLPVKPSTFGQFVSLIASRLGIKEFVNQESSHGWSLDHGDYLSVGIREGGELIDRLIAESRTPKEVAS